MLSQLNKRGDFTGVLFLIVGISAFAFFLIIAGFVSREISTEVKDKLNSSNENINSAFDATTNVATNTLSTLWYIVFAGLLLSLLVTSWYIPSKPVFAPIFLVLLVIAVIIGVAMSNAYEEIYNVADFGVISDSQTSIYFVMSNLPYMALIIGLLGLVVTFSKPGGGSAPMM